MLNDNSQIVPENTLKTLQNVIYYQNEKLIKHIAKVKGWDEKELLQEFLIDEKKKSIQLNMNQINNYNNDSNIDSSILSHSSSSESLDSLNQKKKRGRPPKKKNLENENIEKKKRGRPKKIKQPTELKPEQTKRKRGRPKKNLEKDIFHDPNIDLKQKLDDDEQDIEVLNQYDKQIYQQKQKQLKDVMGGNLKQKHEDESIFSDLSSDEESDVEYEEITCDTIEYQGIQYLLDRCNNNVYSKEKGNIFIGKYDKNKSVIDFNAIE